MMNEMSAVQQEVIDEAVIATQSSQYLTFELSGETYAIDILGIREIIEYGNITAVPMMPSFITGVINLRGSVVPVINLASRFGVEVSNTNKRTSIIIVEVRHDSQELEIGVVVDLVNEVLEISPEDIEPAPTFGAKIRTDFIRGMGKVNDTLLVLLDTNHVLSVEELSLTEGLEKQTQLAEAELVN